MRCLTSAWLGPHPRAGDASRNVRILIVMSGSAAIICDLADLISVVFANKSHRPATAKTEMNTQKKMYVGVNPVLANVALSLSFGSGFQFVNQLLPRLEWCRPWANLAFS